MSVKTEPSGRRSIQVEIEVPGTPEQVWEAIATGPGISSWFVPTEIEAGDYGRPTKIVCHFGPAFRTTAAITKWEPPNRFTAESQDEVTAGPPLATEWTVEARPDGGCRVRVMHSLTAESDDWNGQLESAESGWPAFFRILKLYLTHFAGQFAAAMQAVGVSAEPEAKAWGTFAGSLGISGAGLGEERAAAAGPPPFAGRIEHKNTTHHDVLLRLEQPTTGIAHVLGYTMGGAVFLSVRMYLYGEQAASVAKRDQPLWLEWMNTQFPAPAAEGLAGS
jgi:uncharacterized protein YndB with AHSA1/START domain